MTYATALSALSRAEEEDGDLVVALQDLERAIDARRRLLAAYGENPQTLRDVATGLNKVGNIRRKTGDEVGAIAVQDELRKLKERARL